MASVNNSRFGIGMLVSILLLFVFLIASDYMSPVVDTIFKVLSGLSGLAFIWCLWRATQNR